MRQAVWLAFTAMYSRRVSSSLALALLAASAMAAVKVERSTLRTPMRDGVKLATDLYRPARSGRLPVLLVRTPYGKGNSLYPGYDIFLQSGYAVVIQDVRGRGRSEGKFQMLTQEVADGYDTLAWIARQPWSDGRIGMLGGSYLGISQWKAALSGSPYLKAIAPVVSGYDDYYDRFYSRGGALKVGHRLGWMAANVRERSYREPPFAAYVAHVPLRTADRAATGRTIDFWQEILNHPAYDEFWRRISTRAQIESVKTPALIVGGWYDNFVESDLEAFSELTRFSPDHRVVIGPWPHNMSMRFPAMDFGPQSIAPIRRIQLDWFDRYVKGIDRPPEPPPVRIYVMGANRWRDEREWPLARTRYTPFYLHSEGKANTAAGDGELVSRPRRSDQPDRYVYEPRKPVSTAGGAVCCNPRLIAWGPMDQRHVESRADVLVYTSAPLERDLEVTGPVRAVLYVSTDAPDTDFTAKLVDVRADGRAINLCDGILRLRYREGLDAARLAVPGEVYRVTIEAGVTSNVFRAGHRIRLEVSSSNFPRFDRNPNTGRPIADERQFRPARQAVYHGQKHPSYLLLPVIP
jgi:putative CocE/NonD family hydrolase